MVSGVASLLKAQDPTRTPAQIRDILRSTADDLVGTVCEDIPGWDSYYGYGRLNAYKALLTTTSHLQGLGEKVKVFPNPVQGDFNIVYRLFNPSGVKISFYDRMGKLIRQPTYFSNVKAGTYSHQFTLIDKPAGVYYMKFEAGGRSSMHMIVIP